MADNLDAGIDSPSSSPEGLKRDLAAELDKIGNNRTAADEGALRTALRRWLLQDGSGTSPGTLLYPVNGDASEGGWGLKYDPDSDLERNDEGTPSSETTHPYRFDRKLGLRTYSRRGWAVVRHLRELARDENFEVFMTQLSDSCRSQENEDHTVGSSCRDFLDVTGQVLFTNFVIPRENVLSSAHTGCEMVRFPISAELAGVECLLITSIVFHRPSPLSLRVTFWMYSHEDLGRMMTPVSRLCVALSNAQFIRFHPP